MVYLRIEVCVIKLQQLGDNTAIGLSILCIVHCLFLPVFFFVFPSISIFFSSGDETFHQWLLYSIVSISLFALIMGYIHHHSYKLMIFASFGLSLLIFAVIAGHEIKYGEAILIVTGSLIIAYVHFKNYQLRLQKQCNCCNEKRLNNFNRDIEIN